MTRLFLKLAFSGLRRRRLQTVLTVGVVAAAAAATTVALGVGRVADDPWQRTFAATNGAHVTGMTLAGGPDLAPLERLPGVVDSTGIVRVAHGSFRRDGRRYGLLLYGVGTQPPSVATPLVEEGSWARPGGVVLERSFARFFGFAIGDRIVAGRTAVLLRVDGIAVVARDEPYPRSQPGQAFALEETMARVVPDRSTWGSFVGLRLRDPGASDEFVRSAVRAVPGDLHLSDWKQDRADVVETAGTVRIILAIFSALLLLAGGAVLATLIGGRVLAQERELALLKAAGLTPGQVAHVVLVEQLCLGLAGAAAGLAAGTIATPLFVTTSASLLDASETPGVTVGTVVTVAALVLGAVGLFTLVPAWRAARRTTASLLVGGPLGHRHARVGRAVARLGLSLPVALGARDAFRHPARASLTALSLALTVASVVCTLAMEASLDIATSPPPAPPLASQVEAPAWDPVDDNADEGDQLRPVVYSLDAVLLFVGLANLAATILLGIRERVRDLGLLKAVGLTPRQVTTSFLASQTLVAIVAGLAGIPLGLAIFRLAVTADGSDEWAFPAWWSLALLVPATVAVVLAVAAPLARSAAAIRVVDALRYE